MTLKVVQELFDFDEWATNRTLDSVTLLTEEQFRRDLKSSHGGIHGTLAHICGADWIWLERWKGDSPTALLTIEQVSSRDALKERWESYRRELRTLLHSLNEIRLQEQCVYSDTKGSQHSQPLYQQMLHKINHASYHRGQIVTMLRQLGAKPQNTDLIGFYRTLQH